MANECWRGKASNTVPKGKDAFTAREQETRCLPPDLLEAATQKGRSDGMNFDPPKEGAGGGGKSGRSAALWWEEGVRDWSQRSLLGALSGVGFEGETL